MFQELVYDKVGTQADPRTMPRGLDVMAALGSERARSLLRKLYREDRFANYDSRLAKLKAEFVKLTPAEWNQNIYFGWLYALKLQNEPIAKNKLLPSLCFTTAYADKCLVTTGGSWAQLRHDTILYAKQSYTMMTTAMPRREPRAAGIVYVEPRPDVYAQIETLTTRIMTGLERNRVLGSDIRARLERLQALASVMGSVARDEVAGRKPLEEQIEQVSRIGDIMKDFAEFPSAEAYKNDEDKSMATVADVHTDANSQQVLEVAVGQPVQLFTVAPFGGDVYVMKGGMFSYYEFTRPMSERMTDAQWQGLSPRPPMPEWTKSFVAE